MVRLLRSGLVVALFAAGCATAEGTDSNDVSESFTTLAPVAAADPSTTAAQELPASTSSSTTTTASPKAPISLGFAGDTSFTHGLDARDPLGDVVDLLEAPDLTAVNLETTIGESGVGTAVDKTYIFRSPPQSAAILADAGIDVVSLANNHTLDYRREGLLRTIELLRTEGIGLFGAGPDAAAAYAPHRVQVGDWSVAFVGFTHIECGWVAADPTSWPEAAWACLGFEGRTVQAVASAASAADLTVVMVHWGIEKQHCPEPYQRTLASAWIEAGADLIVGSHPHVLQGVEQIDGTWVIHSTGNFAFPSARSESARSAFFVANVMEDGIDLEVIPIAIVDGRPRRTEASAAEILGDLGRWSSGWTFESGRPAATSASGACSRE